MTGLAFDPDTWEGDFDELAPWRDLLVDDDALCDVTFSSKEEAFRAGLYLGEIGNQPVQA